MRFSRNECNAVVRDFQRDSFTAFNLEDLYNKFENQYEHNFSSACMPILSLGEVFDKTQLDEISKEILNSKLDYCSEFGSLKLRRTLVTNLYPSLTPDDFITTAGASEAIYLAMKTLFSKGDRIIVQKPIYQSLFQVAQDAGAQVIDWQVDLKTNSWDIDKLKDLLKQDPDIKALIINNPNNPVGTAFSKDQLESIVSIIDDRLIISDEVFQPLSLNNCPSLVSLYENAVSICDLSKSFSMPGLRLGWIACARKDLLEQFSAMRNYLSLRTNTISEVIAPKLLDLSNKILAKNKRILKENINSLFALNQDDLFFELDIKKEEISSLCIFPKLKDQYKELKTDSLVKDKSIFLALGENFGKEYHGYCRIGLGNLANFSIIRPTRNCSEQGLQNDDET